MRFQADLNLKAENSLELLSDKMRGKKFHRQNSKKLNKTYEKLTA